MICPRCGFPNVQAISHIETTQKTKGFGCCKGIIGSIIFGPKGWLCGLCGMGKGKSKSVTNTLWICNNCGNKFK